MVRDAQRVIDLSVLVAADLPASWPAHMPFVAKVWNYYVPLEERQGKVPGRGPYQTRFWIMDEHCGTHFDAPTHFIPPPDSGLAQAGEWGSQSGDQVPLEDLMGPAAVIDVSDLCGRGGDGRSPWIDVEHVQRWEACHGSLGRGEVVLFRTGWDRYYLPGEAGDLYAVRPLVHGQGPGWPAPRAETVRYLHERGIVCLGIDAPSIGAAHDGASAHVEGLGRGMRYVELLTRLEELPPRGAFFLFLPVKVAGSTGGPGRAVAFLPGAALWHAIMKKS
jgi:kynurenine formamidase